jgi:hypothetical protein
MVRAVDSESAEQAVKARLKQLANAQVLQVDSISINLIIPARRWGTSVQGESNFVTKVIVEEDGKKLDVFILKKAANEGRLPPGTGEKLASYLGRTDYRALALIGQILAAESSRDIRDLFIANGLTVDIEGDAKEAEEPTNAYFTGSGAASQLPDNDVESLASRMTTGLSISTNERSIGGGGRGEPKPNKSRRRISVPG